MSSGAPGRSAAGFIAASVALAGLVYHGGAPASTLNLRVDRVTGIAARADAEFTRFIRATSRARSVVPGPKPLPASPRSASTRADKPVVTAAGVGAGQAGYVHYFIIGMPDDTLEIQVGIELPDQRIAWSFPDLGVAVSPFIESGIVTAGGKDYEIWHLYGIRPFPDDGAMAVLRKELAGRIQPWLKAGIPYCENDGPRANCMSCLGFVLRALFPGRTSDYPALPRDFWRAGSASRYTTRDLLLYLTGMLELPSREARLQRLSRLALPEDLREDVEELVYAMGAFESASTAGADKPQRSAQSRPAARPAKPGIRPGLRRKL
ncbi:MAG TPA: hypothetical protein VFO57_10695 [Burkholderiales bacterium]|nr:hypothetical protein [Burkholderiales bacterium]